MTRRTLHLLFCLALVISCSTAPAARPYHGPNTPTPTELWNQFRAIHTYATPEMRRSEGRRLDDLLTDEARAWLTRPDSKMRAMLPPERRLPPEVVRLELLGDVIMARRALIRRSRLASVDQIDATSATLIIHEGSTPTLRLPITLRNGSWRFLPSQDLIGSYEDAMPLPTSPPSPTPRTFASPDAAAQALEARSAHQDQRRDPQDRARRLPEHAEEDERGRQAPDNPGRAAPDQVALTAGADVSAPHGATFAEKPASRTAAIAASVMPARPSCRTTPMPLS